MSSYPYQKRKQRNLGRINIEVKKNARCGPGMGASRACYYPDRGLKCKPGEIDPITGLPQSGKCDFRLYTTRTIVKTPEVIQLRYHLDRARQSYGSAIAFRRKYSAYNIDPTTDSIVLIQNPDYGLIGDLRNGFRWQYSPKAKEDGFSPETWQPQAVNAQGSAAAARWINENGKRYHYQAEALMRRGGKEKKLGAAAHLDKAWLIMTQLITEYMFDPGRIANLIAKTLSVDELQALFAYGKASESTGGTDLSQLYGEAPEISPPAFYWYIYEPILRGLPIGKEREGPVNNPDVVRDLLDSQTVQSPLFGGALEIPEDIWPEE